MLQCQIQRLRSGIGDLPLIVATSRHTSDYRIESFCKKLGVSCFRGPLDDVVLRFIQCADAYGLTHIVRVGGDDPLIDPQCCIELIRNHREEPCDLLYASHRKGWPYGCAAELIDIAALQRIHATNPDPLYLEHTIPFFFDHPDQFAIRPLMAPPELIRPELAFTVDFPEDLELIRLIFRVLPEPKDLATMSDVIALIDARPELKGINTHLHQGFAR